MLLTFIIICTRISYAVKTGIVVERIIFSLKKPSGRTVVQTSVSNDVHTRPSTIIVSTKWLRPTNIHDTSVRRQTDKFYARARSGAQVCTPYHYRERIRRASGQIGKNNVLVIARPLTRTPFRRRRLYVCVDTHRYGCVWSSQHVVDERRWRLILDRIQETYRRSRRGTSPSS
jgi:hypothetical protein